MPMLSIIIPTFNSAETIKRCLDSIGNQTFKDLEIVVQDGCSTDNTLDIVRQFQKANEGVEVRPERARDRGVYDAMNRAVSRARGTWLYFLGSDDELHDQHVLKTLMSSKYIDNNDVLYGNVQVIGYGGWAPHNSLYDGPFDLSKLLNRNICHQAIFYRADLARRVGGFNLDYHLCADWDFTLRCWALTKFKYVDLVVAKFHAGGLTNAHDRDDRFNRDAASNVMRYFNLSLLSPLVNAPNFVGVSEIINIQKAKGQLHALSGWAIRCTLRLQLRLVDQFSGAFLSRNEAKFDRSRTKIH
jgi:glycosyltransferase involved in cell wall biosynthesis